MADSANVQSDDTYTKVEQVREIAREIASEEVDKVTQGVREDFIVIFGIFASLLIFLGVEIQVFKVAPRFSMLVGFSLFLLGAIQAFLLGIYSIVKGKYKFADYRDDPIVWFIGLCFTGSVLCFAWAVFN
jgi:hypothetical protein